MVLFGLIVSLRYWLVGVVSIVLLCNRSIVVFCLIRCWLWVDIKMVVFVCEMVLIDLMRLLVEVLFRLVEGLFRISSVGVLNNVWVSLINCFCLVDRLILFGFIGVLYLFGRLRIILCVFVVLVVLMIC